MTIINAILLSMLLVNMAADINQSFAIMFSLSSVIFVTGLLLTFNMVRKVERMEIWYKKQKEQSKLFRETLTNESLFHIIKLIV